MTAGRLRRCRGAPYANPVASSAVEGRSHSPVSSTRCSAIGLFDGAHRLNEVGEGGHASETVVVIRGDFSDEDRVEGVAVDVDCLVDGVLAGCTEFNSAGGVDGEVPAGADGGVVDVSLDRGDREGPADLDRGGRSIGGFQR